MCAVERFVIPYKATEDHPLTEDQEIVNKAYSQRRMPAEHIMALIKNHPPRGLQGQLRADLSGVQDDHAHDRLYAPQLRPGTDSHPGIATAGHRFQASREAAVGIGAWGTDSYQPWDPQEPWDSDDDQ